MNTKKIFLLVFSLIFLMGVLYSILTPRVYQAKSQVALFRYKISDPDNDFEEGKNRWVWIRDGLNVKSALVTDELIKGFVEDMPEAKSQMATFPNYEAGIEAFKKMINVQFTGADENNYIIDVKSSSPKIALELNKLIFMRLRFLAVDSMEMDFNSLLSQLNEYLSKVPAGSEEAGYYQQKIRKLAFRNKLEKAQREKSFQVITMPTVNDIPVWPKPFPIIVLSLFAGAIAGLFAAYVYEVYTGRQHHVA